MKKQKPETIVIGITGGLSTGKSTAAAILQELTGAPVIDADKIGHGFMEPGSVYFRKIIKAFGKDILSPSRITRTRSGSALGGPLKSCLKKDGFIDRKILGEIVFCSPDKLNDLEDILHPAIISEIIKQINNYKKAGCKMVILDAPLLIETGLTRLTDKLIVVSSLKNLQIKRFAGKDKSRKKLAEKIIASQMPLKEKIKSAGIHIKNNSSKTELKKLLEKSLDKLLK